jgi:N-acyl-D-aspartate/D-glutamate deacylase
MHDAIIRGGTIVDGLGGPARTADVAIRDGRIAEIGRIAAPARRVVEADGALVTPGFIDIHTHYDGQFLWDDRMDPSFSHGVTTAIGGNCGVGFAPVAEHRKELMELMEGVEDIPGIVLDEGLDWNWRSYPDYLDRLAGRQYAMDIASHITHAPVRVFAMGERALRHEPATSDDIAAMCALVREAMAAGAVGFSNGRITTHLSSRGAQVPGTFAEDNELLAIAAAMGEGGHGVFQLIPKGTNGAIVVEGLSREARMDEHRRFEAIARAAGRPVTYTLMEIASDLDDLRMMAGASEKALAAGLQVRPQMTARGLGSIQMLDGYHVFLRKPSYRAIAHLPLAARAAAMRDPAVRAAILAEDNVDGDYASNAYVLKMMNRQTSNLPNNYVLSSPLDCEPGPDRRISALAAAAGKAPEAFIYDHYAEGDGANFSIDFPLNYARGSLDHVHEMFQKPYIVSGLGDGGAHMRVICDASAPTFQLAFWTRARTRGERLPLELVVRKLTAEPAELYGLSDRGALAVGKRADINVVDYENLTLTRPRVAHDLPSGAGRLLQGSEGYLATFVAGTMTRERDADTGARPGRLVRAGAQADRNAHVG